MHDEYSIFRKFPTLAQANELSQLLSVNGIETQLADNVAPVDVTFTGNTLQNEIEVRVKQIDFIKAELLLEKEAERDIRSIDHEYHLFKYKNKELYEILLKSDEWSAFDYALAKKILIERGKPIDNDLLTSLKKRRLDDLTKPDSNQRPWIITGYLFAFIGGFLGLIIGYFLWTSKKTLPNGQKVYSYSKKDRIQGKIIFIIGLIVTPIIFVVRVLNDY